MNKNDDEFLQRINATFRVEAEEHMRMFTAGLIELEKTGSRKRKAEITETLFREIHSLKGAARSVDQKEIESLCHPIENLFSALKRNVIALKPQTFEFLFRAAGRISALIASREKVLSMADFQAHNELIIKLKEVTEEPASVRSFDKEPAPDSSEKELFAAGSKSQAADKTDVQKPVAGTVRIPVARLDRLLLQAEEMIQTKISLDQRITELKEIRSGIEGLKPENPAWRQGRSRTGEGKPADPDISGGKEMNNLADRLSKLIRSLERDQYSFNRLVSDHIDDMKQSLMLPVSTVVESFPLMVKEISRQEGKIIDLVISGSDLEVDKRILEEFKDPLIHLIRNSIDHGIGQPSERIAQNKPPHGTITLSFAARESGIFEIILSDDGKGINPDEVLKSAIRSGQLPDELPSNMSRDEILTLIFNSGVSTSPIITDISGRGLGLSIVREKVENLNGKITVESARGSGTQFHIFLPMSLATFRSLMVSCNGHYFMIPSANIDRVIKVERSDISLVEGKETIRCDGRLLRVAGLGNILGLNGQGDLKGDPGKHADTDGDIIKLVVLTSGENTIAFRVEEVYDERQILVKGLGTILKRVRHISGATVLGNGKIVPVLNAGDLMKSGLRQPADARDYDQEFSVKTKKILVAEDSVTARALLKNILETAGFSVTTAVDGNDAIGKVRTGGFDLVVSDVDMPNLNGFELTSLIRNDKLLSETPVVLVTALESREDRERGIEAGADAYIIKSSFDQDNLLSVIEQLL